jgi:hypothetical protein
VYFVLLFRNSILRAEIQQHFSLFFGLAEEEERAEVHLVHVKVLALVVALAVVDEAMRAMLEELLPLQVAQQQIQQHSIV